MMFPHTSREINNIQNQNGDSCAWMQNGNFDIPTELRNQKHDEFVKKKRRQMLLENNQELRQLQTQLRTAYISKELSEQKEALERQKEEEKRARLKENEDFEAERLRTQKALQELELKDNLKKEQFRSVLRDQMAESKSRHLQNLQELLRERESIKNLTLRLEAEQAAEKEKLELRKELAKQEMQDAILSQELSKKQEEARNAEENAKLLAIMQQRDEAKRCAEEEKRREYRRKQAQYEQMGQQLFETQLEKHRRENLLLDLLVEERKANEDFQFRRNLERQEKARDHIRRELEKNRQDVLINKQKLKAEEDVCMRAEQERIREECKKLDQLSEEQRRQKVEQYRQATLEMIEQKRRQRVIEAAEKVRDYELLRNEELKEQQLIEEERCRLLKNHSTEVLRYMPPGALRETDRAILNLPSDNK